MLHAQSGQNVHGRHRSVSPLSRRVSASLRSGSHHTGSGSNGAAASSGAPQPARSSSRGRGGFTRAAAAGAHHQHHSSSSNAAASSSHRSRMSDPGVHPAGSSSLPPHGLPPRSRTPPPLRAVAMPLDPQVLNPDTDFSLDLVKVQFKCTYATSFGQELRLVGGAPELGAWDVAQAPAMTWNNGHVWMMNAFLPPGTYPFKVVVYTPAAKPEAARWENGPNRSITIDATSPELGPAALVLVECQFDSTQHTNTQTKRIGTGIGFKATNLTANRHLSTDANGNGAGPAQLPSAQAMANAGRSSSAVDSSYRASMLAAAGIPTQKVTARLPDPNAVPPVPQQVSYQQHQHQHQHQPVQQFYQQQPAVQQQQEPQYQQQQQQEPAAAAAAAAPVDSAEQHMPGTDAFNNRIADLDSRLAALLAKNGKQPPAAAANNIVGAPAAASVVVPTPQPSSPSSAAAPVPAPAAAAAPVPAAVSAIHQAPPEVQAAAAVCKEDPGAADACRVVTKFISEHLEMIESQALEMMKHNERLEQRMAALEQHTQDYDDNIMQALADSLVLTPDEDLQQQLPPAPAVPKPVAVPGAAAAAHAAPTAAGAPAASGSNGVVKASAAAAAGAAAATGGAASAAPATDAADLVRSFMANFGSGSMLSAGQRPASAEPLAPAAGSPLGSVVLADDEVIDISASMEEVLRQQEQEEAEQQQEQEQEVAAVAAVEQQEEEQQQEQLHAPAATAWQHMQEQHEQHHHEQHVPAEPEQQLHAEHVHPHEQQQDHEQHQELFVSGQGNGSSAQAFAAALDSTTTPAGFSVDAAAAFVDGLPAISTGPPVAFRSEDPNWQAAHARALQWATNQVEPEWDEEEEEEDEEVPWWLKDNLPAARKAPTPIGAASDRLASPPNSPTSSSRLRWSRARFTAPGHVLTADQLLQDEQEGEDGEQDEEGRSLRRPTAAQSAFSGSAVTLATATPATAAAAAAAAEASPLVQNLQQHAYKAAKAFGQSDQAAAIAATAIASRVAFGCDPEAAAATITSPRRRRSRSSSGSGTGSAAGTGSSAEQGTIAGAMAAAVRTRQQVLAVTDLAAQLTAAGDVTGASGPPELGGQGGLDTGVAGFDARPESLVPSVPAGPFQLADDVLVLPSAQQIAAGTYQQQHGEAGSEGEEGTVFSSTAGSSGSDGEDADDVSDAELLQLAALQQENLMLSELASLHTRVIGLHEQAMKLEKEAHAEMEAGLSDSATTSSSFDDFETEGSDSDSEADGVGGVLGLALKTAEKRNGRSHKHDASAVQKLMAAVQLRMEAALLQKEASEKRRALNAMRTAAASASAATFDRHWQPADVEAAQQQVQQDEDEEDSWSSEDDSGSDDSDGGSSNGGGYGGGGGGGGNSSILEPVPVAAGATATMAAMTAAAGPAAAAPAPWGTLEVQPVAMTALRAAMAAPPAAAAAAAAVNEQAPQAPPQSPWDRPMATPAAPVGADTHSSRAAAVEAHAAPLELPQASSVGAVATAVSHAAPAAAAPVLMTAAPESSSQAPVPPAATAVAADVQEDMQAMRSKIAELQRKVVSRKSQLSALMGGASPAAVAALAASHSADSAESSSSGSAASILGAAAAAAAATAVAAAVPAVAPPPATPTVLERQQSGGDVSALLQGRAEVNGKAVPALKSVAVAAAGGAAATAAAGSAAANSPSCARFASRVLDSPALVSSAAAGGMDGYQSIYAGSSGCVRQDRLAELQARTAAAVAAREQLSAQAAEAQQALAAISSSRQAAAAAAAAAVGAAAGAVVAARSAAPAFTGGADDSSSSSKAEMLSQRAEVAAKAVEALTQWEDQAATAKQSLADLEQQAAAALAELEAHEAARQTGQVLRQQMMAQHRTQQVAYGWQQPGGPMLVPASSAGASARPAAVAPMVAGGGMLMDIVAEGLQTSYVAAVPDPAAAAVISSLAAVTAVQAAASHILHDTWHL